MQTGSHTGTGIQSAAEILKLGSDALNLSQEVKQAFSGCVQERFSDFLTGLKQQDYATHATLTGKLQKISGGCQLPGFLFTPEVLHRILFCDHRKHYAYIAGFLVEAIDAYNAIDNGFDILVYKSLWTTNGSHFIAYDQTTRDFSIFEAYRLNDTIPFDFLSPYCVRIDNAALNEPAHHTLSTYEFDEMEGICNVVEEGFLAMQEKMPAVATFLENFTNVVVFKKLHTPGKRSFISSTSDYLVGRTLLINTETVSVEDIVDGLVHENTHSLLNMLETIRPWQPSVQESEGSGYFIVSPWSGNSLTARNFLQANFVWFALFNFWNQALEAGVFSAQYAAGRVQFIRKGFQKAHLHALQSFNLGKDLVDTLADIRNHVLFEKFPAATSPANINICYEQAQ
jgi:hypothetical protein